MNIFIKYFLFYWNLKIYLFCSLFCYSNIYFLSLTIYFYNFAGILNDVQKFYSIGNSEGGLLQTSFIVSYMIMAPIFGYLGDRYSRKLIIAFGVTFWSVTTLLGSFIPSNVIFELLLSCYGYFINTLNFAFLFNCFSFIFSIIVLFQYQKKCNWILVLENCFRIRKLIFNNLNNNNYFY